MDMLIVKITVIIIGLILGSFINVLSYRIPKNIPAIFSRYFCPKCNINIPLYRNIPIITYILQRRKCHNCNKTISLQYPIIEFLTASIFYFGLKNNWPIDEYALFIWISSILIAISIIDQKTLTIPLRLIIALLIGELIFIFLNPHSTQYMLLGLLFGLGYLGITFLVTLIIYRKQTLGYGDLLLISLIGLWLGPINTLICIFLSSLAGIIIWLSIYYKNDAEKKLPFGTYLSISAIFLKILNINFTTYINNLY